MTRRSTTSSVRTARSFVLLLFYDFHLYLPTLHPLYPFPYTPPVHLFKLTLSSLHFLPVFLHLLSSSLSLKHTKLLHLHSSLFLPSSLPITPLPLFRSFLPHYHTTHPLPYYLQQIFYRAYVRNIQTSQSLSSHKDRETQCSSQVLYSTPFHSTLHSVSCIPCLPESLLSFPYLLSLPHCRLVISIVQSCPLQSHCLFLPFTHLPQLNTIHLSLLLSLISSPLLPSLDASYASRWLVARCA